MGTVDKLEKYFGDVVLLKSNVFYGGWIEKFIDCDYTHSWC